MQLLPLPNEQGVYRYPDGCAIWPSFYPRGRWLARWADHTPLRGDYDETSYFSTPEEAAQALAEGNEGPASPLCGNLHSAYMATLDTIHHQAIVIAKDAKIAHDLWKNGDLWRKGNNKAVDIIHALAERCAMLSKNATELANLYEDLRTGDKNQS